MHDGLQCPPCSLILSHLRCVTAWYPSLLTSCMGVGLSPLFPNFSPLFYSSTPTILIIIPVGTLHYSHKRPIIPAYSDQPSINHNYVDGNFLATRVAKKLSRGHTEFFSWELAHPLRRRNGLVIKSASTAR